jgi:hypothetical protein
MLFEAGEIVGERTVGRGRERDSPIFVDTEIGTDPLTRGNDLS